MEIWMVVALPVLVILLFAIRGFRGGVPRDAVILATISSAYAVEALLSALSEAKIQYYLKADKIGISQVVHIQPSYGQVTVYVNFVDFAAASKILAALKSNASLPPTRR